MTKHPRIQVGSQVIAKRASGVNASGERGVCYEVYQLGGRPGYSIIFERGGYDGFSPQDVEMFLHVTGQHCPAVADYDFSNVTRLKRDFDEGRFAAAFPPLKTYTGYRLPGDHLAADVLGDDDAAHEVHQKLKRTLVAALPKDGWSLNETQLRLAIADIQQQRGQNR